MLLHDSTEAGSGSVWESLRLSVPMHVGTSWQLRHLSPPQDWAAMLSMQADVAQDGVLFQVGTTMTPRFPTAAEQHKSLFRAAWTESSA